MQRDGREIGSLIKSLVFANEGLRAQLKSGVFPYPAIEGTEFPFITYQIQDIEPYYTKDRADFQDTVSVEILIWATDYAEKLSIATGVYKAMQNKSGVIDGFDISGIQRTNESEMFVEDVFGQSIIFKIDINKI
jgi:hypothetical protein